MGTNNKGKQKDSGNTKQREAERQWEQITKGSRKTMGTQNTGTAERQREQRTPVQQKDNGNKEQREPKRKWEQRTQLQQKDSGNKEQREAERQREQITKGSRKAKEEMDRETECRVKLWDSKSESEPLSSRKILTVHSVSHCWQSYFCEVFLSICFYKHELQNL